MYRIMIGQGKIYVSAFGRIYPNEYNWPNEEYGYIHFVTDL